MAGRFSVRARLTLAMAVITAVVLGLVALLAPGAVRNALEDDALGAEAEEASNFLAADLFGSDALDLGALPFDLDGLDDLGIEPVLDEVFDAVQEDLPFDIGSLPFDLDDVFGSLGPGTGQLSDQVRVLADLDRLELLVDAAGGDFVVDLGFGSGAIVRPDGTVVDTDDVERTDLPVMTVADFEQYLFDAVGDQVVDSQFESADADRRIVAGVVGVDDTDFLVTADADGIDRSVDRIRLGLWLAVPIVTAIAAAAAWFLAARVLRPVGRITDRASTITSGSLDARVPVPDTGDEISELATTVNEMLDRLESDDRTRRRFVSDASHELRSPVAVMRSDAEIALRHPDAADASRLADVVATESARLTTIIDDLLALARADEGLATPTGDVDLDDLVLAQAARTRRVAVDTTGVSAGRVRGRSDELSRVVGHLLDNAARHARSQVRVAVQTTMTGVELTVDDDGPGIPADQREQVFERFVRLDDARSRDDGGAGLGLAVVSSTVERSGGTTSIASSPLGGARIVVSFPR